MVTAPRGAFYDGHYTQGRVWMLKLRTRLEYNEMLYLNVEFTMIIAREGLMMIIRGTVAFTTVLARTSGFYGDYHRRERELRFKARISK